MESEQEAKDFARYLAMPNASVPFTIAQRLKEPGGITPTPFSQRESILTNAELRPEVGFARLSNDTEQGDYLVAMTCPMPGVTANMIDWWFWWHPRESERYQLWFPGEHRSIGYARANADYFESAEQPPFRDNTQYPVERIGSNWMPLEIDFVTPNEFGFSQEALREAHVATIVCGHVGAFRNLIPHTEMAHVFFQDDGGLFLTSRFWIGERLKSPLIRKAMLTDRTARSMAEHCCVEYRNLARKLPELYATYGPHR